MGCYYRYPHILFLASICHSNNVLERAKACNKNTVDERRPTYSGSMVVMVDLGMFNCVEFAKANGLVKCDGDVWRAPNR